jgi:hypothetical protein
MGGFGERRWRREELPIVARPPIFIRPNRRKGTERVVTFGAMSRITITSSGFEGMSFEVMIAVLDERCCGLLYRCCGCMRWDKVRLYVVVLMRSVWNVYDLIDCGL